MMDWAELRNRADLDGKAEMVLGEDDDVKRVVNVNPQSSVELTRTRSGGYHWRVKLYFEDEAHDNVMTRLEEIDGQLRAMFTSRRRA